MVYTASGSIINESTTAGQNQVPGQLNVHVYTVNREMLEAIIMIIFGGF